MAPNNLIAILREDIETHLKEMVFQNIPDPYTGMREMMAYHLGWEGEGSGVKAQGKRIRPLLMLLCSSLFDLDWRKALPAAASVELLHNFSLIHDDIEDKSELRRGRNTLWRNWGVPQAINCGDAMFSLAQISMLNLGNSINNQVGFKAVKLLNEACLDLTSGQFLDMHFETQKVVTQDEYMLMIEGKTAVLLATSAELGAIVAESSIENQQHLRSFGKALGLAFQCWDDWLGIWGDENQTGKSNSSDLLNRKKTLPVLYAQSKKENFFNLSKSKSLDESNINEFVNCLEDDGAKAYTEQKAIHFSDEANRSLDSVEWVNMDAFQALKDLTTNLLRRNK